MGDKYYNIYDEHLKEKQIDLESIHMQEIKHLIIKQMAEYIATQTPKYRSYFSKRPDEKKA